MKKFFTTIPNRHKAIYLIWVGVNIILLLTSGNVFKHRDWFYPFGNRGVEFDIRDYDYSEFLIYLLIPIIIYYVIKLWNKKDANKTDSN